MAIHSSPAPSLARHEHRSTACIALRFRRDRGNFASARLARPLARVVFPSSSGTVYQTDSAGEGRNSRNSRNRGSKLRRRHIEVKRTGREVRVKSATHGLSRKLLRA